LTEITPKIVSRNEALLQDKRSGAFRFFGFFVILAGRHAFVSWKWLSLPTIGFLNATVCGIRVISGLLFVFAFCWSRLSFL
jgi:hypothetical protein